MDTTDLARRLYNMCVTASPPWFAADDWLKFKLEHHMEPSQCEAVLVLTIRRLCSAATDLQLEHDQLARSRRPMTARDIRDALLKERARTGATLDNVISDIVELQFGDVPFDIVQRGICLAKRGLERQMEFEDDPPF